MHLVDTFIQSNLHLHLQSDYTFLLVCVPWELNPQSFALLTQCSTTEPQELWLQWKYLYETYTKKLMGNIVIKASCEGLLFKFLIPESTNHCYRHRGQEKMEHTKVEITV